MLEPNTPQARPITLFALPEAWNEQPVKRSQYLLPVAGVLLMLLAGGQIWAQGLFVLSVGIVLWKKPPRYAISRQIDAFSLTATIIVLLTFVPYFLYNILPLRWFKQGRWRFQIDQADISNAFFYTPQPLLTLELFFLLLSVLALIALLVHGSLFNALRWRIAIALTLGLSVLAALGLLGGAASPQSPTLPALHWVVFPNFGTTMAIGSLLAFALLFSAVRERWVGGVVLMAPCLFLTGAALLYSGTGLWSWTALVAILWATVRVVRKRKVHGLIKTTIILFAITSGILIVLGNWEGSDWILSDEGATDRIVRYYDSATIVLQQSAMGVGLGNFKYIFPFYQSRSLAQGQLDSPGNDWLLASAEGGLFGLTAFALLACALFLACLGKSRKPSAPVRFAAACALLVFLAGSMLQTPTHYLGTVLLGILCLQLARPHTSSDKKTRSLYPRWIWKTQSVLLILVGLLWLAASLFQLPWQSDIAERKATENFATATAERNMEAVQENARNWLRFTPLAWQPYMERGNAYIVINRNLVSAKNDMNRTLVLIPGRAELPLRQGILWLPNSKQEAEVSFQQALERHSHHPDEIYRQIVAASSRDRDFQRPLARLSQTNSRMRFAYLIGVPQSLFGAALSEELRSDATLSRFTEEQRRELIERWAQEGNTRSAIRYLEEHPDVVAYTWYLRGLALARIGSLKEANELFCNSLPMAQIPVFLTQSSRRTEMPLAGFKLPAHGGSTPLPETIPAGGNLNHLQAASILQRQLDSQQWDAAQQTLKQLLAQKEAPAYAAYWSGKLHNDAGNYSEAWPLLEKYARHYLERRWEERDAELRGELIATPSLSTQAFERWRQIDAPAETN